MAALGGQPKGGIPSGVGKSEDQTFRTLNTLMRNAHLNGKWGKGQIPVAPLFLFVIITFAFIIPWLLMHCDHAANRLSIFSSFPISHFSIFPLFFSIFLLWIPIFFKRDLSFLSLPNPT